MSSAYLLASGGDRSTTTLMTRQHGAGAAWVIQNMTAPGC